MRVPWAVRGLPLERIETPTSVTEIADRGVGIVRAALAVAETGSVVLVEPDPVDRYVSLLTRHLIVVVREEQIVATLAEAFEWLASQPRAGGLCDVRDGTVAGRRTLRRSLTIGVQGPSRLTVALLGGNVGVTR